MQSEPAIVVPDTPPQLLLSLPVSDNRIKFSLYDSKLPLSEPGQAYMVSRFIGGSLAQFLEELRASPSAVPCRIMRLELSFDQCILLEVSLGLICIKNIAIFASEKSVYKASQRPHRMPLNRHRGSQA